MNDLAHLTCPKSFLKVQNIDCFEMGTFLFHVSVEAVKSRSLLNVTESRAVKSMHVA